MQGESEVQELEFLPAGCQLFVQLMLRSVAAQINHKRSLLTAESHWPIRLQAELLHFIAIGISFQASLTQFDSQPGAQVSIGCRPIVLLAAAEHAR